MPSPDIERWVIRHLLWEAKDNRPFVRVCDGERIHPWRGVEARRSLRRLFARRAPPRAV